MAQAIESYLPGVRDNGGLVTNEPASFTSSVAFSSVATFSQPVSLTSTLSSTSTINGLTGIVNVNPSTGTNITLSASQSGSIVLMNSTTGCIVTLPATTAGLYYIFSTGTVALASGSYGVTTATTGVGIAGGMVVLAPTNTTGAASVATFMASGSTGTFGAIRMNGTTTGGSVGTNFTLVCTSSVNWQVIDGISVASGALATPFFSAA